MAIQTSRGSDGIVTVTVTGQLIVANRQDLKDVIAAAVDTGDRRFIIDFSDTAYIDSSGLGAMVSVNKRVREVGGELRIAGLNEDLRSLFELTRLDTLFAISNSVAEAAAGF